ncbi:hypothetical protein B5M42_019855 [Paenibacillus athensensis]|uniref:YCII-related domain-containing protein n=1 Tax=Paenibacillus athensensis TaxID=1967502 RepID=A0A4Y8Q2X3_9BACL|nr:hypothetical protein [Paenibacillus athensensis]MCD1261063.1 hypothetical protein [Paenibacillus athensensis]
MNPQISDEFMRQMLTQTKAYTLVILKATAESHAIEGADRIRWEHGRNNFRLREEGILAIVCPVTDGGEVSGVGIFNAPPEEVKRIMDADPGVQAGMFTYEVHACRSFPGDRLPE